MKRKLLLVLGLVLLLVGCSNTNTNEAPETKNNQAAPAEALSIEGLDTSKEYVMGLDDTFAPMGFRDEQGELVGFDIDLANKTAELLGINITFQPIDWSMKETELNAGNIDMIWNGYSVTDARKEVVNFTEPYLENRQIIIVLNDSDVTGKADLAGKSVSIQAESSAIDAVKKDEGFIESLDGSALIEFPTNVECFKDLEAGRSDAVVADEVLARYYMKQNGEENYKVLDDNFGEEEFAVGVRKDDDALLEGINEAFAQMREDGTYDEYYEKWFSEN